MCTVVFVNALIIVQKVKRLSMIKNIPKKL